MLGCVNKSNCMTNSKLSLPPNRVLLVRWAFVLFLLVLFSLPNQNLSVTISQSLCLELTTWKMNCDVPIAVAAHTPQEWKRRLESTDPCEQRWSWVVHTFCSLLSTAFPRLFPGPASISLRDSEHEVEKHWEMLYYSLWTLSPVPWFILFSLPGLLDARISI